VRTVVQALDEAAQSTGTGFRFIDESGTAKFFDYAAVARHADRFGGAFQELGLARGDRVALVLANNSDFVFAFLGALCAGLVPVPIYPPAGLRKLDSYLANTLHIVEKSGAKLLVADARVKRVMGEVRLRAGELGKVVGVERIRESDVPIRRSDVALEDTCFLQFTSGSTARPKGVIVSHENLAANVKAFMEDGLQVTRHDSGVSWLPLYHDMGLIGFVLGPLYHQNTITFLSPLTFLKRPGRWLQTISMYGATVSFGPNFAYALCAKRLREVDLEGLDLSTWRVAGCGAEPINAATLASFVSRFASVGFDERALLPCYGMAEATLAVSFAPLGGGVRSETVDLDKLAEEGVAEPSSDAANTLTIVNCGATFAEHDVAAFDPDDAESETVLPDRRVGELRVRGPSVTRGYFAEPELTERAFAGGWLRTGDLGYLVRREVFVCGRTKELVIIRGRNYFPQDLERHAALVKGVRPGNVVAFGIHREDGERVVMAAETKLADPAERCRLADRIRRSVQEATGVVLDEVVILDAGVLPKTSSGKLQRTQALELFERGRLESRRSVRVRGSLDTARVLAQSQIAYARRALFGTRR